MSLQNVELVSMRNVELISMRNVELESFILSVASGMSSSWATMPAICNSNRHGDQQNNQKKFLVLEDPQIDQNLVLVHAKKERKNLFPNKVKLSKFPTW